MHWLSCSLCIAILVISDVRNGKATPAEAVAGTSPAPEPAPSTGNVENCSDKTADATDFRFLHEDEEWFKIPGAPNPKEQASKLKIGVSVDYHWEKKLIFYSWRNRIWRAKFTSKTLGLKNAKQIVKVGVDGPLSLAVDWVHDRLYWMTTRHQAVEVSDLEGRGRTLLVDNIRPIKEFNNIVVDPYEGFFFFVSDYSVFRSNLNATRITRLDIESNKRGQVSNGVRCIALDRQEKRVYITGLMPAAEEGVAPSQPFLDQVDYEGYVLELSTLENVTSMDVISMEKYNGKLYFLTSDSIHAYSVDLDNSPSPKKAVISTVRVLHPYDQRNCSKSRT